MTTTPPPPVRNPPLPRTNAIDEILPNLYLGSLDALSPAAQLHGVGITHVLSITRTAPEPGALGGFRTLHLPAKDIRQHNFLPSLLAGLQFLEDALTGVVPPLAPAEPRVFVHCRMGISRSSSVVLAYLMKHHPDYATFEAALRFLRQKRPVVCPNRGFRSQVLFLQSSGWELNGELGEIAGWELGGWSEDEAGGEGGRERERRERRERRARRERRRSAEELGEGWGEVRIRSEGRRVVREVLRAVGGTS